MKRVAFLALASLLWVAGCSSSQNRDRPARSQVFETGRPVFDLEAGQQWEADQGGILVSLGLPRAALVYVRRGSSYVATYSMDLRVRPEEGSTVAAETSFTDTLRTQSYEETQSLQFVHRERAFRVPPGAYIIEAVATDEESGEMVTRQREVQVTRPSEGATLSRIRLETRRDTSVYEPLLSYQLVGRPDTLRAAVSLYHLRRADTAQVSMRLLRFPSDTTAARPPHGLMPPRGSLEYRGVRFDRADTLQRTHRAITHPEQHLQIAFALPSLSDGVHRIEVDMRTERKDLSQKARTFTVQRASFPRVRTMTQMIQALTYLADREEMEHLEEASSPAERRRRFDGFWGKLIPQKQRAADVIQRYYSRVEEANRRYTTYEAGWKTDRGMIYILFGEPLYVEENASLIRWHYSYNERNPTDAFEFRKVHVHGEGHDFEHYLLRRDYRYQQAWHDALRRWRQGEVR